MQPTKMTLNVRKLDLLSSYVLFGICIIVFTVCNIDSSTSEAPAPVQKSKNIFRSGEIVKNDEGADETRKA